jgi:hypothetical protein
MTYPEGDMRYVWDGPGMTGPVATCSITDEEIRLRPRTVFGRVLGWPELVIPASEVSAVEASCSATIGSVGQSIHRWGVLPAQRQQAPFELALARNGVPLETLQAREKWRWEGRMLWNQMRWGGRARAPRRRRLLP